MNIKAANFSYQHNDFSVSIALAEVDYQKCLEIRKKVFIEEQGVSPDIELDEFEDDSLHFLIKMNEKVVGASRLRKKEWYLKFERIAVLSTFRGQGIGKILMQGMREYARNVHPESLLAMHAQTRALSFYEKLGWKKIGDTFLEANIEHCLMVYNAVLDSDRMILRNFHLGDIDHLQGIFSDPVAMQDDAARKDRQETIKWIQKSIKSDEKNGLGFYACHLKKTGEFVGTCGLVPWDNIDGKEGIQIAYLFVKKHRGKGLIMEAAKACARHANETLGIHQFISLIRPALLHK